MNLKRKVVSRFSVRECSVQWKKLQTLLSLLLLQNHLCADLTCKQLMNFLLKVSTQLSQMVQNLFLWNSARQPSSERSKTIRITKALDLSTAFSVAARTLTQVSVYMLVVMIVTMSLLHLWTKLLRSTMVTDPTLFMSQRCPLMVWSARRYHLWANYSSKAQELELQETLKVTL